MTIEQKIQLAVTLANANRDSIPDILEIFGLEQTPSTKPPRAKPKREVHNSVKDFLYICGDVDRKISAVVYAAYCDYCKGKEAQPLTHIEFSRQINRALNSKSIVQRFGKTVCRVFASKGYS